MRKKSHLAEIICLKHSDSISDKAISKFLKFYSKLIDTAGDFENFSWVFPGIN